MERGKDEMSKAFTKEDDVAEDFDDIERLFECGGEGGAGGVLEEDEADQQKCGSPEPRLGIPR